MIKKGKQGTPFEDPYAKLYNGVMGGDRKLVAYTNEYGGTSYKFEDEMGDSSSEPVASTLPGAGNSNQNMIPSKPVAPSMMMNTGADLAPGANELGMNTEDVGQQAQNEAIGLSQQDIADAAASDGIAAGSSNGGLSNQGIADSAAADGVGAGGNGGGGVSTGQNGDDGGVGYAKGGMVKTEKCPHCGMAMHGQSMGTKKPAMKMAHGGQVQTQPMAQKGLMAPAHYAGGGPVGKVAVDPAQDMEDSIPVQTDAGGKAQLTNGEFVVPAAAVRQIGVDKLNKLVQKALEQSGQQEQITPPEAQQQQNAPAGGGLLQPGAPSPVAPKTATSTTGLLNLPSNSRLPMGMSDQMASIS